MYSICVLYMYNMYIVYVHFMYTMCIHMYMHAYSEALLRTTSAVSMVTIEVALVALKSKLEVKMSATKLPSCVTVKT